MSNENIRFSVFPVHGSPQGCYAKRYARRSEIIRKRLRLFITRQLYDIVFEQYDREHTVSVLKEKTCEARLYRPARTARSWKNKDFLIVLWCMRGIQPPIKGI
jgi:hypothetical protein